MSDVSPQLVKELRQRTGAGMMDCKAALVEAKGSMDTAIEILRKRGLKDLSKRAGKTAAEGMIGVYVHPGDQVVAVVELNCETDFVARNHEFKAMAKDLAMHVAAMKPRFLNEQSVPAEVLEKEKEIFLAQLSDDQRAKADKILAGRMKKFFEEAVLMSQPYVKDDSGKLTIKDLVEQLSVKTGEKVEVRRFNRFEVGEGVEKSGANFVDEVAALVGTN